MSFRPNPNDELTIGDQIFHIAEHPAAPGMAYGQTGRRGTVYQLIDEGGIAWALKVFQRKYREPRLVGQAERIQQYTSLNGLSVCDRRVFTSTKYVDLIREHMDLAYAVLMPWIPGRTWQEMVLQREALSAQEALQQVQTLAQALVGMEERGLAHCDLSGPNLIVTPQGLVELVDIEELYGSDLMKPNALPGGSPGYAHKTAPEGLWREEADRFAGAVLIAEMLGWVDERVRDEACDEGYFSPSEMQSNCERFHLLMEILEEHWGKKVADLFEVVWFSDTLSLCPTFTEWLAALPEEVLEKVPESDRELENSTGFEDLSILILKAESASRQGDHEEALKLLKRVEKQARGALLKEVQERIAELECVKGALEIPESAERWQCEYCSRQVPIDLDRCPYCEVGIRSNEREEVKDEGIPSKDRQSLRVESFEELEIEPKKKITSSEGPPITESVEPIHKETPQKLDGLRRASPWIVIITIVVGLLGIAGLGNLFGSKASATSFPVENSSEATLVEETIFSEPTVSFIPEPTATTTPVIVSNFDGPIPQDALARLGKGSIYEIAVSPISGQLAVAGSLGVHVYNPDSLEEVCFLASSTSKAIAFSPDGAVLAAGSGSMVVLWDLESQEQMRTLRGHTNWVHSTAFSPDGKLIATGAEDDKVIIWDMNTGSLLHTLEGHTSSVWSVAFSPDKELLASGAFDKNVILWDSKTGERLLTLSGHTGVVESVAFSPEGDLLASASADGKVILWDPETGEQQRTLDGYAGLVYSVTFSPDGSTLAAGLGSKVILWNPMTGEQEREFSGHPDWVGSVVFSPDGKQLVSRSGYNKIIVWDVDSGQLLRVLEGYSHRIRSLSFSLDSELLAVGLEYGKVILWDLEIGKPVHTLEGHTDIVKSVAFSPDGEYLASGASDNKVILWDPRTGRQLRILKGHTEGVNSVAFSPDGKLLASGSNDKTVILWDLDLVKPLYILDAHTESVQSAAFSPDGEKIASGSYDNSIIIWDSQSGEEFDTLHANKGGIWSVAYSTDGGLLASATSDDVVILWETDTRSKLETLEGHTRLVWSLAFSPGGDLLASGSWDKTVIVWDPKIGKQLNEFHGHTSYVSSVVFSPNGELLASGSLDGTIILWDVSHLR